MIFNKSLVQLFYILLLITLQVLLFNHMVVFNGSIPLFYITFILFYNPKINDTFFLFMSFLLGFGLDLANYTPGVNAFSCVFIAYLRRYVLSLIDSNYIFEANYFSFSKINLFQLVVYVFIMLFLHHLVLFLIEGMKFNLVFSLAFKALISTLLSSVFVFIYFYLFEE